MWFKKGSLFLDNLCHGEKEGFKGENYGDTREREVN